MNIDAKASEDACIGAWDGRPTYACYLDEDDPDAGIGIYDAETKTLIMAVPTSVWLELRRER